MRLLNQGIRMNRKKIQRLMNKYGLKCPVRKANPYRQMAKAMKTNNVSDNLVNREFQKHGPGKILLTDITYLFYNHGNKAYLSVIKDAFTKQVMAYTLSQSLAVDFVLETVKTLVRDHGISLSSETILHSDQGCHYTSISLGSNPGLPLSEGSAFLKPNSFISKVITKASINLTGLSSAT